MINIKYRYDVAISFAEEDRNVALALALALEMEEFRNVYYYPEKRETGWGKDLEAMLTKIYFEEARYVVVLFSNNYFDKKKYYPKIELKAIKARMKKDNNYVYMLPVKLHGNLSFPSFYKSFTKLKHFDWNCNPKEIATALKALFGKELTSSKEKITPGNIIYSSGNQALLIVGSSVKNFNQTIFANDGK